MTFDERAFLARIAQYKRFVDLWIREEERADLPLGADAVKDLKRASGHLAEILQRGRERGRY